MSWKSKKPSQVGLNEIVQAMFPGSVCQASKFKFQVKIVKNGRVLVEDQEEADVDYLCRAASPALALIMPFAVWFAASHPFLIGQAGALLVAAVIGGLGVLCHENLGESFQSGVRDQLGVAKAASDKASMTAAIVKLIWGMRERRPPFATVLRPWIVWWLYSNNVNRFALEPALNALKDLDTLGDSQGKLDWFERVQVHGHLNQIGAKLDEMESVWERSIKWPAALHGIGWYCGGFLFLLHMAIPFLKIWAGR